ncbi:MAG: S24 family peptidase [Sulfurospirillum sp.]
MDFNSAIEKIRVHMQQSHNRKIFDSDIAKELGITKEHFSRSKKSGNPPLKPIIEFCAKENIVINYILFDQSPESLMQPTDRLITVKYFKQINTSAGWGAINDDEGYESIMVDEELARVLGSRQKLKNIEAINVIGDSMEPVIKDGSILFIDRSQTVPLKDKKDIYVLQTPGGMLVKRLDITADGKLKLISQNPEYDIETIGFEDVMIVGKVLGITQRLTNLL